LYPGRERYLRIIEPGKAWEKAWTGDGEDEQDELDRSFGLEIDNPEIILQKRREIR